MKKRFFGVLMALVMVLSLLPTTALATDDGDNQPEQLTNIDNVYITDFTRPKFGQKLDYDISIRTAPDGGVITSGEKAPVLEWYTYNDYTGKYDLVTDPNYVCNARSFMLRIYLYPAENCGFYYDSEYHCTQYWLNGSLLGEAADSLSVYQLNDNGVCLEIPFYMSYDSAHTISTIDYTDMPYCFVIGSRVDAFTPAKLKNDGKIGIYFWCIKKINSDGEVLGMYIAKSQEDVALKLMPELTKSSIANMRLSFGETFKSGCRYILCNMQALPATYQYADCVTANVSFRNGEAGAVDLYGQDSDGPMYTSTLSIPLEGVNPNSKPVAPAITSVSNTSTGITVKWGYVANATHYQLWRKTGSGEWTLIKTTTTNSYGDANRKSGTKYQYKVRAIIKDGSTILNRGAYSPVKTKCYVGRPVISSLSNGNTGITVKWSKVAGATGYKVYRKAGSGDWKQVKTITSGSTTSWGDTNRTNGAKYQYKVVAIKNVSGTTYQSVASAIMTKYFVSRPTISSAANVATKSIKVKWNENAKATGYQVKYVKGSTTKTVTVKGASTLSKTLSSLTKGSTYKIYVRSYKTVSGTNYYSAWSAYKSVKVDK